MTAILLLRFLVMFFLSRVIKNQVTLDEIWRQARSESLHNVQELQ